MVEGDSGSVLVREEVLKMREKEGEGRRTKSLAKFGASDVSDEGHVLLAGDDGPSSVVVGVHEGHCWKEKGKRSVTRTINERRKKGRTRREKGRKENELRDP